MTAIYPDATAIILYQSIIVPWEKKLKSESGCWDVKRSRDALKATDIQLLCVELGEVESKVDELRISGSKNYIVFVSKDSQMKDLFRLLRNCAAHASISLLKPQKKEPILQLTGKKRGKSELTISGQVTATCLCQIVAALVTTPTAQHK